MIRATYCFNKVHTFQIKVTTVLDVLIKKVTLYACYGNIEFLIWFLGTTRTNYYKFFYNFLNKRFYLKKVKSILEAIYFET